MPKTNGRLSLQKHAHPIQTWQIVFYCYLQINIQIYLHTRKHVHRKNRKTLVTKDKRAYPQENLDEYAEKLL